MREDDEVCEGRGGGTDPAPQALSTSRFNTGQVKKPRVGHSPDPQFWGDRPLGTPQGREEQKDQDSSGPGEHSAPL